MTVENTEQFKGRFGLMAMPYLLEVVRREEMKRERIVGKIETRLSMDPVERGILTRKIDSRVIVTSDRVAVAAEMAAEQQRKFR